MQSSIYLQFYNFCWIVFYIFTENFKKYILLENLATFFYLGHFFEVFMEYLIDFCLSSKNKNLVQTSTFTKLGKLSGATNFRGKFMNGRWDRTINWSLLLCAYFYFSCFKNTFNLIKRMDTMTFTTWTYLIKKANLLLFLKQKLFMKYKIKFKKKCPQINRNYNLIFSCLAGFKRTKGKNTRLKRIWIMCIIKNLFYYFAFCFISTLLRLHQCACNFMAQNIEL